MSKEIHMAAECLLFEELGPDGFEAALMKFAELVRSDERNSWPAEMEAMERQVNILTAALAQAKADEREACAKVCDELAEKEWADNERCAAAIRARSNT